MSADLQLVKHDLDTVAVSLVMGSFISLFCQLLYKIRVSVASLYYQSTVYHSRIFDSFDITCVVCWLLGEAN